MGITSEYGTEPMVVVAEDGSRWINVEDVDEMEWLMQNPSLLDSIYVRKRNNEQNENTRIYDELTYPGTKRSFTDIVDKMNTSRLSGSKPKQKKATQKFGIVNSIIHRLRTIKERLTNIQSIYSTMYNRYSIHRNNKPPVVENSDGSKWFNVDDIHDVEKIIGDSDSNTSSSLKSTTEVCVGNIRKLEVVGKKMGQSKTDKNLKFVKEKIICVEYDVFTNNVKEPVKNMRAYLSLPSRGPKINGYPNKSISLEAKNYSNVTNLNDDEIKIIDAEIKEKRGFLHKLQDVLRSDRIRKKNDRAVSTEDFTGDGEVVIHKSKANDLSLNHLGKNISPQRSKKNYRANSLISKKKTLSNKSDVSTKQTRSESKCGKDLQKHIPKPIARGITSKQYLAPDNTLQISSSKFDQVRKLLNKTNQKEKYLQYMRNMREMDCFNEKMSSIYVDVY